jgi:hypothetical protein
MVIECLAISLQLVQSDIHDWPIRLLKMAIECLAIYQSVQIDTWLGNPPTTDYHTFYVESLMLYFRRKSLSRTKC